MTALPVAWVGVLEDSKWGVKELDEGSSGETEPGENRPGEDNSGGYDQGSRGGGEASGKDDPLLRFSSSCCCDKELSGADGGFKQRCFSEDGIVVTIFWLLFEAARIEGLPWDEKDICTEAEAGWHKDFEVTEADADWCVDFSAVFEANLQVAFEIEDETG